MLFVASVLFVRDKIFIENIDPLQVLFLILFSFLIAYGISKIVFRLLHFLIFKRIENLNTSLPKLSDEEKEKIRKLRLKIIACITLLTAAIPLIMGEYSTNNAIAILAFIVSLPFLFLIIFLHYYIFIAFPANYIRRIIKKGGNKNSQ